MGFPAKRVMDVNFYNMDNTTAKVSQHGLQQLVLNACFIRHTLQAIHQPNNNNLFVL